MCTYIKFLHDRFVIVPVDKASNNFGIVCKKFYLEVIKNELGISNDGNIIGNKVYKPVYQNAEEIYKFHQQKLLSTFGMELLDINQYIPLLYWTSKQHKCPYKFRFIAGASKCYNKQLAVELSLALKCIKNHFKNYCKVIEKRTGISYYWSVDNSYELLNKISDIKIARSIKTFDFSTLYTNLPLDIIYDSLRSLIIKMFVNSKRVSIMVNPNRKKAFWSNGSNYAGYREYTIDKLLEALETILFNTYIQFNESILKQILGIPMGGNASPFIADLYLSWCEYCYMTKVVKTDYKLAKLLSYNCRYLDDICTINLKYFGDIAKDIYDNTLILEGSACSYKQDTFLDLYIRVVDEKFVTGIYHKVDDFNFEVISFPFPQSNINTMLGYTTFYSQLIRFSRLCNNINDFLFRAKLCYIKLVKRGYMHSLLYKYFKKFCLTYKIEEIYGERDHDLFFSRMIEHNPSISCNINNVTDINDIVKACSVIITKLPSNSKDTCINNPPLSTSVIVENTSISRISNTDIDNTEEPGSYDLRDIAKCSTIPCENIPPSAPTGDEQINNIHVSRDVPKSRQLVLPYSLNIHIHPFGIVNPKNHCYLNSVIQLLLPILRTISYDFQFNSSTEGTLSKYMLETAYNAYSSTDVDVLKFQLVQYNQFYDGKNQQDSSECLLMLIEIINKGSVPYYGSHVSNSTGVSLSDILFSFMLEKYIVCNVCGLRSPSIESSGVLYISPTHTSSMQELIMQGLQQKLEKSCFRCNKNTWHVESNHILQPPNYLIIVVNRFRYINNQFAKDKCSIPMDMTVVLGYHKFSLQATIDHHGPSIYSGHYTTSVNCCNRTFYCNDNKITEFDMIITKNSSTAYVVIYKLIT